MIIAGMKRGKERNIKVNEEYKKIGRADKDGI